MKYLLFSCLVMVVIILGCHSAKISRINKRVIVIEKKDPNSIKIEKLAKQVVSTTNSIYANIYSPDIKKQGDVSISLILAIIKTESNFVPTAISKKGALGLMQLMPPTALMEYEDAYPKTIELTKLKKLLLTDTELNIELGVNHYKRLRKILSKIEDPDKQHILILASYNAGVNRVKRAFGCKGFKCYIYKVNHYGDVFFKKSFDSLPRETQRYVKYVEKHHRTFQQLLKEEVQ